MKRYAVILLLPLAGCVSTAKFKAQGAVIQDQQRRIERLEKDLTWSRGTIDKLLARSESESPFRGLDPAEKEESAGVPETKILHAGEKFKSDTRRLSVQHYLSGVIYYKKGEYSLARDEWTLANFLDPANEDAKTGLERVEALLGLRKK